MEYLYSHKSVSWIASIGESRACFYFYSILSEKDHVIHYTDVKL
jgi:hypothetical protein